MYLFYRNNGDLTKANNLDIVVKGSNKTNFIFVYIEKLTYSLYSANAIFELPDASKSSIQLTVSNSVENINYEGKTYSGYKIWLTDAITNYDGEVKFSMQLQNLSSGNIIALEQYSFSVQESTISGEKWDNFINQAQYENLMNYISAIRSTVYMGDFTNLDDFLKYLTDNGQIGYLYVGIVDDKTYFGIINFVISQTEKTAVVIKGELWGEDYSENFASYYELYHLPDDTYRFDLFDNIASQNWVKYDALPPIEQDVTSIQNTLNGIKTKHLGNFNSVTDFVSAITSQTDKNYLFTGKLFVQTASGYTTILGWASYNDLIVGRIYVINGLDMSAYSPSGEKFDSVALTSQLNKEISDRTIAVNDLQNQINGIVLGGDIKFIVQNYQELIDTDWQEKGILNGDIVKVLLDETHDLQTSLYRYDGSSNSFTYIGSEGTYVIRVIYQDTNLTTKQIIAKAYNDSEYTNGAILYAKSTDDGDIQVWCNQDKTHFVVIDMDGYIQYATISEPFTYNEVVIGDRYLENDSEIISSVLEVSQGITSKYLSQPYDALVGSNYNITAKLKDSVNRLDFSKATISTVGNLTYAPIANGYELTLTSSKPSGTAANLNFSFNLADLGLQVGDTITVSGSFNMRDFINHSASTSAIVGHIVTNFYGSGSTPIDTLDVSISQFQSNSGSIVIPSGTTRLVFILACKYAAIYSNGSILSFTNLQIQKGSVATAYEPYGAYSKGNVIQYASKNILNIPSYQEVSAVSSLLGKFNTPYTPEILTTSYIQMTKAGFNQGAVYAQIKMKKNHKYFVYVNIDNLEEGAGLRWFAHPGISTYTVANLVKDTSSNIYYGTFTQSQDCYVCNVLQKVESGTSTGKNWTETEVLNYAGVLDLTEIGEWWQTDAAIINIYGRYTLQNVFAAGNSIENPMIKSPLLKAFDKETFLTWSNKVGEFYPYGINLYQFSNNPPALNESVSFDDLDLLSQVRYTSSTKITLNTQTNSILVYVWKGTGSNPTSEQISDEEKVSLQAQSQFEYGTSATEHSDYTAPITIGSFDMTVDGNQKNFTLVALSDENINIGFIENSGSISIETARSAEDYSASVVRYSTGLLANQVAYNTASIETLATQLSVLEDEVSSLANQIPSVPDIENTYVLKSINGVLTWVRE